MDAFDSDVIIYAGIPDHPVGEVVRRLIRSSQAADGTAGIGSTLLAVETLQKPARLEDDEAIRELSHLLDALELVPCDLATADAAIDLGARYRLKTVDAVHLATAINVGAHRFITNNRRDFTKDIVEIDVTYPEDLEPAPT